MRIVPRLLAFVGVAALLLTAIAAVPAIAQETEPAAAAPAAERPRVVLQTTMGDITLELFPDKAPKSVANFLTYVRDGFYDGTVFHRVIPNFMAQGGGFTADMNRKPTRSPIQNEADNGVKNTRGTVAMARTGDPHSATAQFFVNAVDNDFLNHTRKDPRGWGYTVFGQVTEGMDVVDAISATRTTSRGKFRDVPVEAIVITKARIDE
ncbi:MAG: peptidylprolyl isomerase [Acidobacteriota bacterium]